MPAQPTRPAPLARAFSLLELLVVVAILVIVMSIVIPSLSGVRNAARKSASQQLMASLSTSIGQYNLDQRRLPGYFTAREMGQTQNTDFTTMENMLLDLSGGIITETGVAGTLTVGPGGQAGTVRVDPLRIGAPSQSASGSVSKTYFTPDPKYFIKQNGAKQRAAIGGPASGMPVLVDAWGSPILAWRQDVEPSEDAQFRFARTDSRNTACFYAKSNEAFLKAQSLGKLAIDQTESSLLGDTNDTVVTNTMTALLGNPSFAYPNTNPARPSAARAPIVLHSAGVNGTYLGKKEQGGNASGGSGLIFAPNIDAVTGGGFDDFLVTAQ